MQANTRNSQRKPPQPISIQGKDNWQGASLLELHQLYSDDAQQALLYQAEHCDSVKVFETETQEPQEQQDEFVVIVRSCES